MVLSRRGHDRRPRSVILALALAQAVVWMDTAAVNIALPEIQRSLGLSVAMLEWVLIAFLLAGVIFLIPGGAWADHFGRRRMLLIGLAGFATGALVSAVTPIAAILIVARAVQGLSAAMIAPATIALEGPASGGS